MHPVEKVLLDNIDNPRSLFIFPTDVASLQWADHILRIKGGGTIALNKFIAWDTFKRNSIRSQMQNKKSIPGVLRKIFASSLVEENAELCRQGKKALFSSLLRPEWAAQVSVYARWFTQLLPQLGTWFKGITGLSAGLITSADASRLAGEFDGDDRDLYTLGVRYAQFLEEQELFEPAWEKPPFDDTENECFIFYPDCLRDYSEYRELLEESGRVQAIYSTDIPEQGQNQNHDFFFYTNSRSEISEAALYVRALNERKNIRWDSIAVSIPDAENYEPYVLREFRLRNIPFVKKTGKPLTAYPAGQFFNAIAQCVSRNFALDAVNELLLNSYLPWKDSHKIQKLMEFGVNNNCIASWTENEQGKELRVNVWEHAFRQIEGNAMERSFFKDLKQRLSVLRNSSCFANLRKNYFAFREHFFNMEKCLEETDLILSRCISELSYLAEIENSFPGVTVPDPYMFFTEYLGEVNYLAQQKESGVAILPYSTAAPAPYDYHIVIGASQKNLSEVFTRLNFLPRYKREKLGLKDEDASAIFIKLHRVNSLRQAAFFCAENSFSGYAIPYSGLIASGETQLLKTAKPLLRYGGTEEHQDKFSRDLFLSENQFILNANLLTKKQPETNNPVLYKVQKQGFQAWMERKNYPPEHARAGSVDKSLLQLIQSRFCHDPAQKQISVSASSLEKYYQCALIWLFERVLKLESIAIETDLMPYTITGLVYHAVLNEFLSALKEKTLEPLLVCGEELELPDLYRNLLQKSLDKVFDAFPYFPHNDKPVMSGLAARLTRAQKEQFREKLHNFLLVFLSCLSGTRLIDTEAGYFPPSEDSYALNGVVDCILETSSGGRIIVDFKTKSMPRPDLCNGSAEGGLADFQLPLYLRLVESGDTNGGKKVQAALFFSITDKLPQVLFGRIEDKINEIQYPAKNDALILRDDERFNRIMNEFDNKVIQFAAEAQSGRFSNIESDWEKCLECTYNRICRTVYRVGRENNITLWGKNNGS